MAAAERFEDAVGDTVGDAPDIVAVSIEATEEGSLVSISVEFGAERSFGTDMETWTDVIFIAMSSDPTVDERGILQNDHSYLTGTHGVTLGMEEEGGAHLLTPTGMIEQGVGVVQEGSMLTFTIDRELIGDPAELWFQVLVGVERGEEAEGTDEGDAYPELDEPPAHYAFGASDS